MASNVVYAHLNGSVPEHLRRGFFEVYKEAFGGEPYFETYTDEQVLEDVWIPHTENGVVVLAVDGECVVGFGCALPVPSSPADVQEFLSAREREGTIAVDFRRAWYMSELGVRLTHRKQNIAYMLTRERLLRIQALGDTHYVLRTAASGSNSRHLYEKIGAATLPGLQDVSTSDQVQVNKSQSTERVYLYGTCAEGIEQINRIIKERAC